MEPQVGPALYELMSTRYNQRATVITSNKSLATWGEVVGGDTALMMAIIDRLLHHGDVFYLRGASYRMRGKEPVVFASTLTNGSTGSLAVPIVVTPEGRPHVGEHFGGKEGEQ
jgi:hypothetical protein